MPTRKKSTRKKAGSATRGKSKARSKGRSADWRSRIPGWEEGPRIRDGLLVLGFLSAVGLGALAYRFATHNPIQRDRSAQAFVAPGERVIRQVSAAPETKVVPGRGLSGTVAVTDDFLKEEFTQAAEMPWQQRLAYWTRFARDPKNQGALKQLVQGLEIEDSAALMPERFNCTTFVETVAALARAKKAPMFANELLAIRYKGGQPTYDARNHFPEVDWIANNTTAGILRDVTAEMAESASIQVAVVSKEIRRGEWLGGQVRKGKVSRSLASVAQKDWGGPVRGSVSYIPVADLKKVEGQISTGMIVNIVHKDDGKHPVLITHQGFAIRDGGKVMLRHASRGTGEVQTVELATYVSRLKKQKLDKTWTLVGVNFNELLKP